MIDIKKWIKKFSYLEILEAIDTSVSQYIKEGEASEVENAFKKIPRICSVKKRQRETGEDYSQLYYIRGIMRNRFFYVNEKMAIRLLMDADKAGFGHEELKEFALRCDNWTEWRDGMIAALEDEE